MITLKDDGEWKQHKSGSKGLGCGGSLVLMLVAFMVVYGYVVLERGHQERERQQQKELMIELHKNMENIREREMLEKKNDPRWQKEERRRELLEALEPVLEELRRKENDKLERLRRGDRIEEDR